MSTQIADKVPLVGESISHLMKGGAALGQLTLTRFYVVHVAILPVTIILAPILAPLAVQNGMDPIHFAVIFLVGASIGFVTPPYGLNLYVASSVTGVPYMRLLRYALYYLGALLAVWLLVAVTPVLTTMLLPAR